MWFHIFSTWPFSLQHPASKVQVTAIRKRLLGWPGSPFRFCMCWEWRSHSAGRKAALRWVEPKPVLSSAVPEFRARSSAASSLKCGLKLAVVQSLGCFSQLHWSLHSAVKHHVRKGECGSPSSSPLPLHHFPCRGQCLLEELGWQSRHTCSSTLCVLPEKPGHPHAP